LANIYTIYADHKDNITAHEFVTKMSLFLDKLVEHRKMDCYRITRMKLGFRSMVQQHQESFLPHGQD